MRRHRLERKQKTKKPKTDLSTQASHPPAPNPRAFSHSYGPLVLRDFGPVLFAKWDLPDHQRKILSADASSKIKPVSGGILLDTGATATCIARWAAEELGLIPIRMADGHGAGGRHTNPIYLAKLTIEIRGPEGRRTEWVWSLEAQGIPDLDQTPLHRHLTYNNNPVRFIGLLGRDVLAKARFMYDGVAGKIGFEILDH